MTVDATYGKQFEEFCVGFEGRLAGCPSFASRLLLFSLLLLLVVTHTLSPFVCSFGAKHVTPRSLTARYLGNLVCLEGIVTKCRNTKKLEHTSPSILSLSVSLPPLLPLQAPSLVPRW